jgi:hypothetical protein
MCLPDPERPRSPLTAAERPRCVACRDIIGVYEPLVHVLGELAWHTSRAAEPEVVTADGELYHAECYQGIGQGRRPGGD